MKNPADQWMMRRTKDIFQLIIRTGTKLMPESRSEPRSAVTRVLNSAIEKSLEKLNNDSKEINDLKDLLEMSKKLLQIIDNDSYYHTAVREFLEDLHSEMKNLKERNKW